MRSVLTLLLWSGIALGQTKIVDCSKAMLPMCIAEGKCQCEMPPPRRIPDCEHIPGCVIGDGQLSAEAKKPLPLDVAAIQEERGRWSDKLTYATLGEEHGALGECFRHMLNETESCAGDGAGDYVLMKWTCADATRILEHDEQTAKKWWCRKVQP